MAIPARPCITTDPLKLKRTGSRMDAQDLPEGEALESLTRRL
jgi:hypothetical protein